MLIAQLVEHFHGKEEVTGSSPVGSLGIGLKLFGPLVKWLRHRPFTAVTRVRIPYGSPLWRISSAGRAPALQAGVGGSTVILHHIYLKCRRVAKWLNAADCKSAPSGSAVRICPSTISLK